MVPEADWPVAIPETRRWAGGAMGAILHLDTPPGITYFIQALSASPTSVMERLLCELIGIPSVNPAFLPDMPSLTGEQALADFLDDYCAAAGLDVECQEVLPGRPNLLARLRPSGKIRKRILLAPHLDTVGYPGDLNELVKPARKNGRVYGRGACDTKGSIASMLAALTRVAVSGRRPASTEIVFAGLMDEENAQAGSRALVAKGIQADLAIVGEPTQLVVVTAHKGDIWLRLETRGQSAHGARPELGRNAVHEMARIVDLIETDYARGLRRRRHPLLGRPTVNVGSIAGGTQPNIVPDYCFITVDRRTIPGETESAVRRELRDLLRSRKLKAGMSNARMAPCLPLDTPVHLPLVRQLMQAAAQSEPVGVDYFCDAAVLSQGGIPSVVFGPGDIAQAHTAREYISSRSLEAAASLLERFLRSLP
jgi:succinyl-diaminopimelate desuccinylase